MTTHESSAMNLKQVAAALGVHYMTAYRYVRQGRLAAQRLGTEWQVSLEDLEAFRHKVPTASGEILRSTDWAARLEACMIAADEVASWQVIEMALAAGHSPEYCYTMLASSLASIGDRWTTGELDVADQHLATAVATRLIARLGARFRKKGRTRGTFVFGAPTGELHSVPIAIVADLVRLGGYEVLELGANVPAEAFASCALRVPRLVAIGIGVTQPERLESVRLTVRAIRQVDTEVPIVIGGLAAATLESEHVDGTTAYAKDGVEALDLIEAFASQRAIRRATSA